MADRLALTGTPRPQRAAAIVAAVARAAGITPADILGPSRKRPVAFARQVAMSLCRELTPLSLPQIGRVFRRDHTTVIHGVRAVAARRCPDLDAAMERLRAELERTA